jgi:hypothetical protein
MPGLGGPPANLRCTIPKINPRERAKLHSSYFGEVKIMDTTTILIVVVVILLLGGGGWYGRGRWY